MLKTIITSIVTAILVCVLALAGRPASMPSSPDAPSRAFGATETVRSIFGRGIETFSQTPSDFSVLGGMTISRNQQGTGAASTTFATSSQQLVPRDIMANQLVLTSSAAVTTLILPASSTMPSTFLPKGGDRTQFLLVNNTFGTTTDKGLIVVATTTSIGAPITSPGWQLEVATTSQQFPPQSATTTANRATLFTILRKMASTTAPSTQGCPQYCDLQIFAQPFF